MKTLGELLGSRARTQILQVLIRQPGPAGLRILARIADVHPHSAEVALAGIVTEGLAKRRKTPSRALYAINRRHPDVPMLEAVFEAATLETIRARRRGLNARAGRILPFIAQARRMLGHARKGRHAT